MLHSALHQVLPIALCFRLWPLRFPCSGCAPSLASAPHTQCAGPPPGLRGVSERRSRRTQLQIILHGHDFSLSIPRVLCARSTCGPQVGPGPFLLTSSSLVSEQQSGRFSPTFLSRFLSLSLWPCQTDSRAPFQENWPVASFQDAAPHHRIVIPMRLRNATSDWPRTSLPSYSSLSCFKPIATKRSSACV